MSNAFKCPVCSNQLVHVDNSDIVRLLRMQVETLEHDIQGN
jgi:transcription initiation factor IIE alpha subunit